MATSIDLPFMDRWIYNGYPQFQLLGQHRTVPELSRIIFDVFRKGKVQCMVDPAKQPNVKRARRVLESRYGIDNSVAFLGIEETEIRVGATMSKQNYQEVQVELDIIGQLKAAGLPTKDICFITGCTAKVSLFSKCQSERILSTKDHVEHMTIDKSQGNGWPCVIWSVCGASVGFYSNPARLLVAASRAADSLIILANWSKLRSSEAQFRHMRSLRDSQSIFERIPAFQFLVEKDQFKVPIFKKFEDQLHANNGEKTNIHEEAVFQLKLESELLDRLLTNDPASNPAEHPELLVTGARDSAVVNTDYAFSIHVDLIANSLMTEQMKSKNTEDWTIMTESISSRMTSLPPATRQ